MLDITLDKDFPEVSNELRPQSLESLIRWQSEEYRALHHWRHHTFYELVNLAHFSEPSLTEGEIFADYCTHNEINGQHFKSLEGFDEYLAALEKLCQQAIVKSGLRHISQSVEAVVADVISRQKQKGNWGKGYQQILDEFFGNNRARSIEALADSMLENEPSEVSFPEYVQLPLGAVGLGRAQAMALEDLNSRLDQTELDQTLKQKIPWIQGVPVEYAIYSQRAKPFWRKVALVAESPTIITTMIREQMEKPDGIWDRLEKHLGKNPHLALNEIGDIFAFRLEAAVNEALRFPENKHKPADQVVRAETQRLWGELAYYSADQGDTFPHAFLFKADFAAKDADTENNRWAYARRLERLGTTQGEKPPAAIALIQESKRHWGAHLWEQNALLPDQTSLDKVRAPFSFGKDRSKLPVEHAWAISSASLATKFPELNAITRQFNAEDSTISRLELRHQLVQKLAKLRGSHDKSGTLFSRTKADREHLKGDKGIELLTYATLREALQPNSQIHLPAALNATLASLPRHKKPRAENLSTVLKACQPDHQTAIIHQQLSQLQS